MTQKLCGEVLGEPIDIPKVVRYVSFPDPSGKQVSRPAPVSMNRHGKMKKRDNKILSGGRKKAHAHEGPGEEIVFKHYLEEEKGP